jgi:hypothetical protein
MRGSGLLRVVDDICALLGYYAALSGRSLPTFRDNLWVPIGCPETSVQNYHSTLRNIPEECRFRFNTKFVFFCRDYVLLYLSIYEITNIFIILRRVVTVLVMYLRMVRCLLLMLERIVEESARDVFYSNIIAFVWRAWRKLRKSLFLNYVSVPIFGIFNVFVVNVNCLDSSISPEQ